DGLCNATRPHPAGQEVLFRNPVLHVGRWRIHPHLPYWVAWGVASDGDVDRCIGLSRKRQPSAKVAKPPRMASAAGWSRRAARRSTSTQITGGEALYRLP